MDFLDPNKKRSHKIRLYIGYALMSVALGIGSLILVFTTYGYDINHRTGQVIQNGLINIETHPESATIYVNGKYNGTTSNRLVLPAANYTLELQRKNYRSWSHSVNLEGSSIEQFVYPLLFPTNLVTKNVLSFTETPTMATQSPDRKWLVTFQPASTNSFTVFDLDNNKNSSSTLSLPSDAYTQFNGVNNYEAVEWANDNNHLLLKHEFGGAVEYIIFDRENPASSINLNKMFPIITLGDIKFRNKKSDQLYFLNETNGDLFYGDTKSKQTTLVTQHVGKYTTLAADTVLYVSNLPATNNLQQVHLRQNGQDYLLRTLPASNQYFLNVVEFNGAFNVIVGSASDGKAYLYKNPVQDLKNRDSHTTTPFRVLSLVGMEQISVSPISRFVAVRSGSTFVVYDFETNRQYKFDTHLILQTSQKATWMDGHRLSLVSDGRINVFDFDGTNLQKLSPELPAFTPYFAPDYLSMYAVAPQADKAVLTRTELKANN